MSSLLDSGSFEESDVFEEQFDYLANALESHWGNARSKSEFYDSRREGLESSKNESFPFTTFQLMIYAAFKP
ncbi:hypothetical protein L596_016406 [Steinernema carpocapsae]|uniref:Uncharacterized protein n=1 Tax=Steinernema carpocapsae TaxID=34508 RepID=A0A4V6A3D8_STECR|nr:hypothetical protein L596_016406 [Steinernema carpocapsae]